MNSSRTPVPPALAAFTLAAVLLAVGLAVSAYRSATTRQEWPAPRPLAQQPASGESSSETSSSDDTTSVPESSEATAPEAAARPVRKEPVRVAEARRDTPSSIEETTGSNVGPPQGSDEPTTPLPPSQPPTVPVTPPKPPVTPPTPPPPAPQPAHGNGHIGNGHGWAWGRFK